MEKRAFIKYSVKLQDYPDEINRILNRTSIILKDLGQNNKFSFKSDYEELIRISEVRKKLSSIDHSLAEISAMLNSYLQFMLQEEAREKEQTDEQDIPAESYEQLASGAEANIENTA